MRPKTIAARAVVAAALWAGCQPHTHAPGSVPQGAACDYDRDCAPVQGGMAICGCSGGPAPTCGAEFIGQIACGGPPGMVCPSGQYCLINSAHPTGACMPQAGLGASCAVDFCQDGLFCNPQSQCETPHPVGQPCVADDNCVAPAFCASSVCVAPRQLGEPCQLPGSTERRDECATGLNCAIGAGRCVQPQPNGTACSEDAECLSDTCPPDSRRCQTMSCVSP
jgi:hypothetical protein